VTIDPVSLQQSGERWFVDVVGARQIWARMVSSVLLGADGLESATERAQIVG
jgi:hypothetical protein